MGEWFVVRENDVPDQLHPPDRGFCSLIPTINEGAMNVQLE